MLNHPKELKQNFMMVVLLVKKDIFRLVFQVRPLLLSCDCDGFKAGDMAAGTKAQYMMEHQLQLITKQQSAPLWRSYPLLPPLDLNEE